MKTAKAHALFAVIVMLCAGLGASGCHRNGESDDPYTPARVAVIKQQLKYHNVFIKPFTVLPKVEDPGTAPQECHDSAVSFLMQKAIFASVQNGAPAAPAPDTLVAEAELQDLRIVSGGARFWAGAYAGSSYMHIKLVIRDSATGAVVFERLIESDNNAFGAAWSWGASDRGLPANVGVAIADLIVKTAQGVPVPPPQ